MPFQFDQNVTDTGNQLNPGGQQPTQDTSRPWLTAKDTALFIPRGVEGAVQDIYGLADTLTFDALPDYKERLFGESESILGGFAEGAVNFATGFIPVSGILGKVGKFGKLLNVTDKAIEAEKALEYVGAGSKVLGLAKSTALDLTKGAIAGAITDFSVFDGHEARLSNLIQEIPALQNPVNEYMQAKEDDPELFGRLKNAVEGLGLGILSEAVLQGFHRVKVERKLRSQGLNPEQIAVEAEKEVPLRSIEAATSRYYSPEDWRQRIDSVTWNQKKISELSPEELKTFGKERGLNMEVSPEIQVGNKTNVTLPGGLEGKFTFGDLASIAKRGFSPEVLSDVDKTLYYKKLALSVSNETDEELISRVVGGILNPGKNTLARRYVPVPLSTPEEVKAFADELPWDLKTAPTQSQVSYYEKKLQKKYGQVDGSYVKAAEAAKRLVDNPEAFYKVQGEEMWQFGDRLSRRFGLQTKQAGTFADPLKEAAKRVVQVDNDSWIANRANMVERIKTALANKGIKIDSIDDIDFGNHDQAKAAFDAMFNKNIPDRLITKMQRVVDGVERANVALADNYGIGALFAEDWKYWKSNGLLENASLFPGMSAQNLNAIDTYHLVNGTPKVYSPEPGKFYKDGVEESVPDALTGKPINTSLPKEDVKGLQGLVDGLKAAGVSPFVIDDLANLIRRVGVKTFEAFKFANPDIGTYVDFNNKVIAISKNMIANGNIRRSSLHEVWHVLWQYVPQEYVEAITKTFEKEKAAYLAKKGSPLAATDLEMLSKNEYRFKSVFEWFSETMTDKSYDAVFNRFNTPELKGVQKMLSWARTWFSSVIDEIRARFGGDPTNKLLNDFLAGKMEANIPNPHGLRLDEKLKISADGMPRREYDEWVSVSKEYLGELDKKIEETKKLMDAASAAQNQKKLDKLYSLLDMQLENYDKTKGELETFEKTWKSMIIEDNSDGRFNAPDAPIPGEFLTKMREASERILKDVQAEVDELNHSYNAMSDNAQNTPSGAALLEKIKKAETRLERAKGAAKLISDAITDRVTGKKLHMAEEPPPGSFSQTYDVVNGENGPKISNQGSLDEAKLATYRAQNDVPNYLKTIGAQYTDSIGTLNLSSSLPAFGIRPNTFDAVAKAAGVTPNLYRNQFLLALQHNQVEISRLAQEAATAAKTGDIPDAALINLLSAVDFNKHLLDYAKGKKSFTPPIPEGTVRIGADVVSKNDPKAIEALYRKYGGKEEATKLAEQINVVSGKAAISRDTAQATLAKQVEDAKAEAMSLAQAYKDLLARRGNTDNLTSEQIASFLKEEESLKQRMEDLQKLTPLLEKQQQLNFENDLEVSKTISSFLNTATKSKTQEVTRVYTNALLSGPKGHITNLVSNALAAIARPIELGIGTFVGKATKQVPKDFEGTAGTEIIQLFSQQSDSWNMALQALSTGEQVLNPTHSVLDVSRAPMTPWQWKPVGFVQGWQQYTGIPIRLMMSSDEAFKQMTYRSVAMSELIKYSKEEGVSKVAKNVEENFRTLTDGGNALTKETLWMNAYNEGIDPESLNLTDKAAREYADKQVAGALKHPHIERLIKIAETAQKAADEATFSTNPEPGTITQSIQRVVYRHPMLKLVMPFVKTPINVLKFTAQRFDAVGMAQLVAAHSDEKLFKGWFNGGLDALNTSKSRLVQDLISGDNRRKAEAIGRVSTGVMAATTFASLAAAGVITGAGPSDPEQKRQLMATGWRPYSVKIGNEYISYIRMQPFSTAAAVVADLFDSTKEHPDEDQNKINGAMMSLAISLAHNVSNQTYLVGLTEFTNTLLDPQRNLDKFLRNKISSIVPSGVNTISDMIDPTMRETRTITDAIMNRIPGLSTMLPAKRDIFGQPIISNRWAAINPAANLTETATSDAVDTELASIGHGFSAPSNKFAGLDLRDVNENGKNAYDRLQELVGQIAPYGTTLRQKINNLIRTDHYNRLDPEQRIVEIRKILVNYRSKATSQLLKEFPGLASWDSEVRKANPSFFQ